MKSLIREACASIARVLLFSCVAVALPAFAGDTNENLEIKDAWVREMPPGTEVAAGYLSLHNRGARPVRVVSFSSPVAQSLEIHEMKMDKGQMRMRELKGGLAIAPGQTVKLSPGGYHLMLMGVAHALIAGDSVGLELVFDDGSKLHLDLPVRTAQDQGAHP